MIVDARTIPPGLRLETDICIIGAGAAGITLARALADRPVRIVVLEGGGLAPDGATQSLNEGESVGLPYFSLGSTRLRYFGGTTNHWGGHCRPFEDHDFEARDWVPYSGWPIRKRDVESYYDRAQDICQLKSKVWDVETWEQRSERPCLPLATERIVSKVAQVVYPASVRSFGKLYEDELRAARDVTVYVNANVTQIETDEDVRKVTHVAVGCLGGNAFTAAARYFVLAAGGIENPRLLLLSNHRRPAGLGNEHDLVGRFFLEHPRMRSGIFLPSDPRLRLRFYDTQRIQGAAVRGYLGLTPAVQRAEKLVGIQIRLDADYDLYKLASKSDGVASAKHVARRIRHGDMPQNLEKHLANVIADMDEIALTAWIKARYRGDEPVDRASVITRIEPVPNPDSRITLSSARDALGLRRPRLDWRLSPLDKHSMRRTLEIFAAEIGRTGLGRVQVTIDPGENTWPQDMTGGWHHMGTTRMSDDPKSGVVDRNCRVHGLANLYVAGSSVFPTAGSGTPTLLIVALALRLADHIEEQMT